MNKARGSPWCMLILLLLGSTALSNAYGVVGPPSEGNRGVDTPTRGACSRSSFLQTASTVFLLMSAPSAAVAKPDTSAAAKLQAGFDSLNKEVDSIDRVLTKQAKKIDRAVTKKTKPLSKQINKEVKKATKETKKVMKKVDKKTQVVLKEVDKKTQVVTDKAKKLGTSVGKEAKAFIPSPPKATGGVDVSKLKVCRDPRGCL